jgi:hypothetical protein
MGVDLYTLRKKAVIVTRNGIRGSVYFLQLAVEHALSRDSQEMVDSAVKQAYKEWRGNIGLPEFVVGIGSHGLPQSGSPIFRWQFFKRSYCFDHELPAPFGYLGEREINGYIFRTASEQACLNTVEAARRIDEGSIKAYKDFWHGEVFKSGAEFLRFRNASMQSYEGNGESMGGRRDVVSPRVSKILNLIRFIEKKGRKASPADLSFLESLREKAGQLGCSC